MALYEMDSNALLSGKLLQVKLNPVLLDTKIITSKPNQTYELIDDMNNVPIVHIMRLLAVDDMFYNFSIPLLFTIDPWEVKHDDNNIITTTFKATCIGAYSCLVLDSDDSIYINKKNVVWMKQCTALEGYYMKLLRQVYLQLKDDWDIIITGRYSQKL